MNSETSPNELDVLNTIIRELSAFDKDTQIRLIQSVATFLNINIFDTPPIPTPTTTYPTDSKDTENSTSRISFSQREDLSPKDFLLEKEPRTNHDRVACLAYYLTYYRDTPHFKTLDLSRINTEAAQPKFTNSTVSVKEATKRGILVPAGKGKKQLSALAEQYVQALPDREAAMKIMKRIKPVRKRQAPSRKTKQENSL